MDLRSACRCTAALCLRQCDHDARSDDGSARGPATPARPRCLRMRRPARGSSMVAIPRAVWVDRWKDHLDTLESHTAIAP
jgi:hypothetical protein